MEMRTYTGVWRLQRRLAHVQGVRLPVQWTLSTFGVWLAVQTVWAVGLWSLTDVDGPAGLAWTLGPPVIVASLVDRIRIDGRPVLAAAAARLSWVAQPRQLHALAPPTRQPRGGPTPVRIWTAHHNRPSRSASG